MLEDITYLDKLFYNGKTKYKNIIDSIVHYLIKFYQAFLTEDKTSYIALEKIKMFILINKKTILVQTYSGLKFVNNALLFYLKEEDIKKYIKQASTSINKWIPRSNNLICINNNNNYIFDYNNSFCNNSQKGIISELKIEE